MKIDYEGRNFRSVRAEGSGEVDGATIFRYHQSGNTVWAEYEGGSIVRGQLIAIADENGSLEMRYHHLNESGHIMAGKCRSTPELLEDGRLRLHETWEWTTGDRSSGSSILEEIRDLPKRL